MHVNLDKSMQRQVEYENFPDIALCINGKYGKFWYCSCTEINGIIWHTQINPKVLAHALYQNVLVKNVQVFGLH